MNIGGKNYFVPPLVFNNFAQSKIITHGKMINLISEINTESPHLVKKLAAPIGETSTGVNHGQK